MIQERHCSQEVSKLLRDKGFDETCDWYYPINGGEIQELTLDELNYHRNQFLKAPTHQMACDWLREVHHICITIYPDKEKGFEAVLYDIESDVEIVLQSFGVFGYHIFENFYEAAVESALKYSLEKVI